MDIADINHLAYLTILLIAVIGWWIAENRHSLARVVRMALAWGFIFVGLIAAYGLWTDIRDDIRPSQAVFSEEGRVEVPRGFDGHYYLTLEVDGTPVRFVVDTGASEIVLSRQDAARVGLDPDRLDYLGTASTANGQVNTARAILGELALGGIVDRNVGVSVNSGEMDTSLLGMSYLQRFERIEISDGRLVLER
jgi:aspartyl protease family protein